MNPFATDNKDVLICLSSGASAPEEIEQSLFDAYRNRLEAHKKLQDRLVDKTVSFYAPLKKQMPIQRKLRK
jgi:hypothetical protein